MITVASSRIDKATSIYFANVGWIVTVTIEHQKK